jgi:hypothetical protein
MGPIIGAYVCHVRQADTTVLAEGKKGQSTRDEENRWLVAIARVGLAEGLV